MRVVTVGSPSTPPQGWALRAYRFALDPTAIQERMLRSHCGAQRFAYNWGLALIKANLGQREAERSYGIGEDELTPAVNWSAYSLRKTWNTVKVDLAPWWVENSKEAYSSGIANLAASLGNWSASRSGERQGARVRFPRFKSKRAPKSCRFTTGALGLVAADRQHVKLPKIGVVRTHESTRKLARHLERGSARVRSATVTSSRCRWFVSFSVEVAHRVRVPRQPDGVVGIDLGITHLAVLSRPVPGVSDEHGFVANPRHLDRAQARLRCLQRQGARRQGPDKRTRAKPSKRWLDTQARIARLHARVANSRTDGLHKLTTGLVEACAVIVVEDLHVAAMIKNRRLARHIAGAGWGGLRRQLDYKTRWRHTALVIADRWYPSSKTCSCCGVVKTKLRLNDRVFRCEHCGFAADRDLNAARNLAALADQATAGVSSASCVATLNEPDGNPGKTSTTAGSGYRHGKTHAVNVA